MRHHAWMQAIAVSQRAAWVLVPRPLNCCGSMLIDWRPAQKTQCICFGASWGACNVWGTKQELAGVSS